MTSVIENRDKYMEIYSSLLKVMKTEDLMDAKKTIERRAESPMYALKMAAWELEYNSRKIGE